MSKTPPPINTENKFATELDTAHQAALWDFEDAARSKIPAKSDELIRLLVGKSFDGSLSTWDVKTLASDKGMDALTAREGDLTAAMADLGIKPADAKVIDPDVIKTKVSDFMAISDSESGRSLTRFASSLQADKDIDPEVAKELLVIAEQKTQRQLLTRDQVELLSSKDGMAKLKDELKNNPGHLRIALVQAAGGEQGEAADRERNKDGDNAPAIRPPHRHTGAQGAHPTVAHGVKIKYNKMTPDQKMQDALEQYNNASIAVGGTSLSGDAMNAVMAQARKMAPDQMGQEESVIREDAALLFDKKNASEAAKRNIAQLDASATVATQEGNKALAAADHTQAVVDKEGLDERTQKLLAALKVDTEALSKGLLVRDLPGGLGDTFAPKSAGGKTPTTQNSK